MSSTKKKKKVETVLKIVCKHSVQRNENSVRYYVYDLMTSSLMYVYELFNSSIATLQTTHKLRDDALKYRPPCIGIYDMVFV